jgi:ABC-type multidrug transport system fused ATPase/permease subunit
VTGDVNAMGNLFAEQLGEIAQAALLGVGMTIVLLFLDPVLALVSLATSPLLLAISWVYRRRVRRTARVQRAHEGRIASVAGEALSAMTVVKAFGSERYESDRVRRGSEHRMEVGVQVARLQAGFDGLVGSVRAIGTAAVLVVGVMRVASGAISPGDLIVFTSYTRKAYNPLKSLARETAKIAAAMAKADRIAEIFASDELLEERPGAYRGPRAEGDIALEGVSFGYGDERPVLRDVSLQVPAGGRIALMGPSGAGKSTLASLIARFHDPGGGRVLIDGRDARDCALEWLRGQVAVVLQDTVLFSGTVRENIAYGSGASDDEVCAAARSAAADAFIRELPRGYDTELGPQGMALSGGQRQRIGIARTLLRNPPILLLDEPTTSLDEATEEQLLDGLRALMEGRTTVLVTHSARLAALADRTVRIEAGRVADPLPDADSDAAVLARSLAPGADLSDVEVGRVVYKPGELIAVHYRARVDGAPHDAVVTRIPGADLAASVRKPRYADRAQRINGRSPAPSPLTYDADAEAIVSWLPFDPRLPALGEPPHELARRLGVAAGEVELLGYKPRSRAVLRLGGLILKAYGRAREYEAALAGLRAAQAAPFPTADFAAADAELRLTAQRELGGERPGDAVVVAREAGRLAAALQAAPLAGLADAPADRALAAAVRKAEVIAAVLPDLRPRLDALVARLRAGAPDAGPLVPAHGDFHVDQLLQTGAGIAVIDFDELSLAPPALDLATYAADVVRGRPGDAEQLEAVIAPLLAGYGGAPDTFEWHLATAILGRAAHPFQRQVPHWRERVEATVAAAEETLA